LISVEYPTLSKRLESDNTFYESNISVFRVYLVGCREEFVFLQGHPPFYRVGTKKRNHGRPILSGDQAV